MNPTSEDIVVADKGLRTKVLVAMVLLVLALIALTQYWTHYLEQLKGLAALNPQLAIDKLFRLLRITLGVGMILVGVAGFSMVRTAMKTLRAGRFPPPGMKVIRDTRIVTGISAKLRAILLIVIAVLLIAFQVFALVYLPRTLEQITTPKDLTKAAAIEDRLKSEDRALLRAEPHIST
jgi:hypothetical protein